MSFLCDWLAGRVFGGYQFSPFFGLEVGFTRYANFNALDSYTPPKHYAYSAFGADLVGKLYLPLGDSNINLYGLGGVATVKQSRTVSLSGYEDLKGVSVFVRPKFGLGVSYDIPNLPITTSVEVTRLMKSSNSPHYDMASFNLAYKFD